MFSVLTGGGGGHRGSPSCADHMCAVESLDLARLSLVKPGAFIRRDVDRQIRVSWIEDLAVHFMTVLGRHERQPIPYLQPVPREDCRFDARHVRLDLMMSQLARAHRAVDEVRR
jgi:hypothetical protein